VLQVLPAIFLEENTTHVHKRSVSEDLRIVLYYDESVYRWDGWDHGALVPF
jgi:hypothetical protein